MVYRTVLFDVGGTLVGPRESFGETYARVLAPLGLVRSAETFEEALRQQWDEMNRRVPVGVDRYSHLPGGERGYWLEFVRGVVGRVGDGSLPADFTDRVLDGLRDVFRNREAWDVFDDVVPTLETLREAGARMGVVSNWDSRLPAVLERLGLAHFFDTVIVSGVEGVEKPDPRIFRRAVEALDADPKTTAHVGDLPEIDIDGARAAGLYGVLVDRTGRLDASLKPIPDLRPLPDLLSVRA
jgi:putative hydrolase of the HAD superfamily